MKYNIAVVFLILILIAKFIQYISRGRHSGSRSRYLSLPIPNPEFSELNPKFQSRNPSFPNSIPIPNPDFFKNRSQSQSQIPNFSKSIPIPNPNFFKMNPNPKAQFFQNRSQSRILGLGFGRDRWDLIPKCRPLYIRYKL